MDPNQQDRDWCRQAAQGNASAAERLLEAHYARVFAYHRRQVASDADAADLTQDTFQRVWKSLPQYGQTANVGTWIHRIAYCTWIDWLRGRNNEQPIGELWWEIQPCPLPSPLEAVAEAEEQQRLWKEVAGLPEEERQIIHLHFGQQLTQTQTAEVLTMPLSTLKVRLHSALQRLRRRMSSPSNSSLTHLP
jgi:RNA polymerase sigma-70 factor (ECF subfamily)